MLDAGQLFGFETYALALPTGNHFVVTLFYYFYVILNFSQVNDTVVYALNISNVYKGKTNGKTVPVYWHPLYCFSIWLVLNLLVSLVIIIAATLLIISRTKLV